MVKTAGFGEWKQRDGSIIAMSDMNDRHIENALRWASVPKTQELRAEMARRKKLEKIGIRVAPPVVDEPYDIGQWH